LEWTVSWVSLKSVQRNSDEHDYKNSKLSIIHNFVCF
jgi:hypothetical protein